jgi:hypothetical protein
MILLCLLGFHAWSDIPTRATVFDREADPKKRLYQGTTCGQVRSR